MRVASLKKNEFILQYFSVLDERYHTLLNDAL